MKKINNSVKKLDNKGFTLVELIIVIAIIAVLAAVIAPQYLKYVEKSRVSADASTLSEVLSAAKIAVADEDNNISFSTDTTITIVVKNGVAVSCGSGTEQEALAKAINDAIGATPTLKSSTYKDGASCQFKYVAAKTGENAAPASYTFTDWVKGTTGTATK